MRFLDRWRGIRNLGVEEAQRWMAERGEGGYTLLDVRQPQEYEGAGHIPGALLIPLPELPDRLGKLAPEKPVLAY
ncbi:MAG: rhodanese-like domain-containing protein [Deferrisomatales bacterium]